MRSGHLAIIVFRFRAEEVGADGRNRSASDWLGQGFPATINCWPGRRPTHYCRRGDNASLFMGADEQRLWFEQLPLSSHRRCLRNSLNWLRCIQSRQSSSFYKLLPKRIRGRATWDVWDARPAPDIDQRSSSSATVASESRPLLARLQPFQTNTQLALSTDRGINKM